GFHEISWDIRHDGAAVTFDVDAADDGVIVFDPTTAGVYQITATATVGGQACDGGGLDLNVRTPGAVDGQYRLRIVPFDGEVPPQDIDLVIPSGADFALGSVNVTEGLLAEGTALGPGSTPLEGYVRAGRPGDATPLLSETFADENGDFALRLLPETYELLVVPDSATVAPARLQLQAAEVEGDLLLAAGDDVSGTVRDGAGDPVVGARVSLSVDGVPSTVGVTGGGGGFALRARAGAEVVVTVVPPEGSGLPQLAIEASDAGVADGSVIDVDYAAALDTVAVAPELRLADGTTPAPGARVTWRARAIAAAGTVSIDGADATARGTAIVTGAAGVGGDVPATSLPEAVYDVVVEPAPGAGAGQGVRYLVVDLAGAPPAVLALAAPARLGGVVMDADGEPVPGARLRAEGRGALSGLSSAGGAADSDDDGAFELRLAGDGSYDVVVDGAAGGEARVRLVGVTAPAAGAIATRDVALPATRRVDGTLAVLGGAPVRAHVELVCLDCEGGAGVVAEAVSDPSGHFVFLLADRE
ncbi:MAG TPA: carboxypeptidase-like regulatory domain-containing protein, partial [Kofleriaceae bacterium]|nr:carboxypeptidase-like regulatory domain-containing protein [Kofleriaceae bacterium]